MILLMTLLATISAMAGATSNVFLYELRSKRRVPLTLPNLYAASPAWSRDGLQIFFTVGVPGKAPLATNRIFWDGTGEKRYSAGSYLVVGK